MSKRPKLKRQAKRKASSVGTSTSQRSSVGGGFKNPLEHVSKTSLSWQEKSLRILSVLGLALTVYLSYVAFQKSSIAFCTQGSGCDVVQQSQWSRFLGVPLALWGLGLYVLLVWTSFSSLSRLKKWKLLWRLSFIGLSISIYLTLVAFVSLGAFCIWCLASFTFLLAIFSIVHLNKPQQALGKKAISWYLGHAAFSLLIVSLMFISASNIMSFRGDARLHDLAVHLEKTNAKFYGAYWCPSCMEQKKKFSGAATKLPYVECSPNGPQASIASVCAQVGVTSFPTWIINGRVYLGVTEPQVLANLSGFEWEEAKEK